MATEVRLPELGESVTEGTITEWLVNVGDEVNEDDPLFELSSDKIDTEVPSPASGILKEIRVDVDETVEVGTVVAVIGDRDEEPVRRDDAAGDGELTAAVAEPSDEPEARPEAAEPAAAEEPQPQPPAAAEEPQPQPPAAAEEPQPVTAAGSGEEVEVRLPELGESVTEGTITEWLVNVGDEVNEDDPLFELSSDKIDTEVPSPASGILKEIRVDVDETVEVGTVVAVIGAEAPAAGEEPPSRPAGAEEPAPAEPEPAPAAREEPAERPAEEPIRAGVAGGDALMSPIVRRMVAQHDLDPAAISGSGKGGRITRQDVQAVIQQRPGDGAAAEPAERPEPEAAPPEPAVAEERPSRPEPEPEPEPAEAREPTAREHTEKLTRIRRRIASRMMESLANSAQLTTVQEADMTMIMTVRSRVKDQFRQREGVSLSPFAFLARAAVIAIKRHPTANARVDWEGGEILYRDYVNLGVAVDTERGLLVPNIKNADDLTLPALARAIYDVATRARGKGQLDMDDIQGGTFTVTNTGSRGVLLDTPILNHPEVAILGTGAIQQRPVVVQDRLGPTIAVRDMVYLCLTYDHQILDGADAARYVTDVKEVIETHDWATELGID